AKRTCQQTGFYRDGKNLTATIINPTSPVTGDVSVIGCNIGVYFGPGHNGSVDAANIHGADYYGVVVQQATVNIKNSNIHDIGDNHTFTGGQHGVGVYYANVEGLKNGDCVTTGKTSGLIDGNSITEYQKGGVAIACPGANVTVTNNHVLGLTQIPFIAQNGIQFGYGAAGEASGNEITGNWYQGADWTSIGLLLFDVNAKDVKRSNNSFRDNQTNFNITTRQACPHMYGGVYEGWGLCTF
ncbi:MAG: right-handed parallel beta-helix repeat-containing protein, partial [Candidatus Shapirobacteria bacterium]